MATCVLDYINKEDLVMVKFSFTHSGQQIVDIAHNEQIK